MTDNEDRTLSDEVTKARDEVRRALAQIAAMAIEGTASDARIQEFAAQRLRILSAFDMLTAALDRVRDDAYDALDRFGHHSGHCRVSGDNRCSCGLDDIRARLSAARTQPEGSND